MKAFRIPLIAIAFAIVAACSSTPSTPTPAATTASLPDISGYWLMDLKTPAGGADGKMWVTQDGNNIKGTLDTPHGPVNFTGTVSASEVKFSYQVPGLAGPPFEHTGAVTGASMKGNAVFGSFGVGTWEAKRR